MRDGLAATVRTNLIALQRLARDITRAGDDAAVIADLDAASTSLQQIASDCTAQPSIVSAREDFTSGMSNLLTAGAEHPVAADMDMEGVMLLALRTRRDLAATSLSLAAADKTALRLFVVSSG